MNPETMEEINNTARTIFGSIAKSDENTLCSLVLYWYFSDVVFVVDIVVTVFDIVFHLLFGCKAHSKFPFLSLWGEIKTVRTLFCTLQFALFGSFFRCCWSLFFLSFSRFIHFANSHFPTKEDLLTVFD